MPYYNECLCALTLMGRKRMSLSVSRETILSYRSRGMGDFLPVCFLRITLLPCLWNLTMLVRTVAAATPLTWATCAYGKTSPSNRSVDPYRCFTKLII